MHILLIGGTRFLGRHLAEQALAAGHELTLLHRGQTGADLFPQARHLLADRNGDLAVLDGAAASARWDVAIDTCAYVPRHVRSLAQHLAGRVGRYQLVSSVSVYAGMEGPSTDEEAAVATLADPATEAVTAETYGALKALCEAQALASFGAPAVLVVRPGLLVGPFDPTGRFTWWVQRLARGGEVLAPGDPAQPVQLIDARDAAAWMLAQAAHGTSGIFNLAGPGAPLSMQELLDTGRAQLSPPGTSLTWVDEEFLLAREVAPWSDLPLWLSAADAGLHRADISRALACGLVCRGLADTFRDTGRWAAGVERAAAAAAAAAPGPPRPQVGLAPEREAALLQAWRERPAA